MNCYHRPGQSWCRYGAIAVLHQAGRVTVQGRDFEKDAQVKGCDSTSFSERFIVNVRCLASDVTRQARDGMTVKTVVKISGRPEIVSLDASRTIRWPRAQ